MPDKLTPQQRHKCMSHIRSKDTKPEIKVRKALFALGYRYRITPKSLPGRPDIVLARYRTAIFVNGCFWHGHKNCRWFVLPKTNREFWESKITRNRERDDFDRTRLEALGWNVLTIWECQLKGSTFDETIKAIAEKIESGSLEWENLQQQRRISRAESLQRSREMKKHKETLQKQAESIHHIPHSVKVLSEK